jgi:hypothetical protein
MFSRLCLSICFGENVINFFKLKKIIFLIQGSKCETFCLCKNWFFKAYLHVRFQTTISQYASSFLCIKICCSYCKPAGLMQNQTNVNRPLSGVYSTAKNALS